MTPPAPTRNTAVGRAYNDLRNLARRHGRNPAEYFTLYALEGFLTRLATSPHASSFVLKGGVLMAAYAARRPTRDVDLAATGMSNDTASVEERIREIVTQAHDDGLTFDHSSIATDVIRDEADYHGVRAKLRAHLAQAAIPLHIDINFGDPIWPAPTTAEVPLLLGGSIEINGYPDHMVLAEKLVTAIERGQANTRWRDFVDMTSLTRNRTLRGADLFHAIQVVAQHRHVQLQPLRGLTTGMPARVQSKWSIWRSKQRIQAETPEHFDDLLTECCEFADPILTDDARELVWNHVTRTWVAPSVAASQ